MMRLKTTTDYNTFTYLCEYKGVRFSIELQGYDGELEGEAEDIISICQPNDESYVEDALRELLVAIGVLKKGNPMNLSSLIAAAQKHTRRLNGK